VVKLKIGIDGYNLARRHGTGVATYGFALARALQASGHEVSGVFGLDTGRDPALREVMFFDQVAREEPKNVTRRQRRKQTTRLVRDAVRPFLSLRAEEVPITHRVERSTFDSRLPVFDRLVSTPYLFDIAHMHFDYYGRFLKLRMTNPPEIMHWTYPVPVELVGARNIYTLHDLVPLRLPYTTLDTKKSYNGIVRHCAENGAHICTVSEASRADILDQFGIDPARVTNCYQASPMDPATIARDPAEDAAMIEGIFGLQAQRYFMFFGAIEPKKNLGRLIEAYLSIQSETPLVIVGAAAWQSDDELRLLPKGDSAANVYGRNVAQRIIRLDYLPRGLLLRLIRGARAVLFPSIYEGFGLPVLEAMQLGTPVLTSHTSSLPEVAGTAACFVDPYDIASISAGLRAMDSDLALRSRLAEEGPIRADFFSEEKYRARLDAMYASVMASA